MGVLFLLSDTRYHSSAILVVVVASSHLPHPSPSDNELPFMDILHRHNVRGVFSPAAQTNSLFASLDPGGRAAKRFNSPAAIDGLCLHMNLIHLILSSGFLPHPPKNVQIHLKGTPRRSAPYNANRDVTCPKTRSLTDCHSLPLSLLPLA